MHARLLAGAACAIALFGTRGWSQELFDALTYVTGSDEGYFRAQGDFDGDGDPDLLHVAQQGEKGMTVFLNEGGTFLPQAKLPFGGAAGFEYATQDPAVGDFDGDGLLDVAIDVKAPGGSASLRIHRGDGAGGFGPVVEIALGNAVRALHAGEIDGDAAAEVFVDRISLGQPQLTWIDWNGSGVQLSAPLLLAQGETASHAVGDFDGDGDDDVAATSADATVVRLYPTVAGAATAGPAFPTSGFWPLFSNRIAAGDLDGDGDVDLVHVGSLSGSVVRVQPYEQVGGALNQRPLQFVSVPHPDWFYAKTLSLGDWDGDGWSELFSHYSNLSVVRSNGDWTFGPGFDTGSLGTAAGAGLLDADGDGRADYCAARTILFGDGTFSPLLPPVPCFSGPFYESLLLDDAEGDGDVDLIGGPAGARGTNDGTGKFEDQTYSTSPPTSFFPVPPLGHSYAYEVSFADFDGDGLRDYLVQLFVSDASEFVFKEMRLLVDDGLGFYVDAGVVPMPGQVGTGGVYLGASDIDGDGDLDLLDWDGYWRNAGTSTFDAFVPAYAGLANEAADVDADGDRDLIGVQVFGGLTDIVLHRASPGGFIPETVATLGASFATAGFTDLDGDGDPDVVARKTSPGLLLLIENQAGTFAPAQELPGFEGALQLLGIEDFDADGIMDLLTLRRAPGTTSFDQRLLVTARRGTGVGLGYEIAKEYVVSAAFLTPWQGFRDVDGDGDLDVIGKELLRGNRVSSPEGGVTRQFGAGVPGTGGFIPVLGAESATSTSAASALHLVRGVGGAATWIAVGLAEVALPGVPLPGMTLYVGAPTLVGPLLLGGTPGMAGTGEVHVPLPHVPALFGISFTQQAFLLDPGSVSGWSASNGLQIVFGL